MLDRSPSPARRASGGRRASPAEVLAAAIRYAKAGWAVIPLQPRGKAPLTEHGVLDATTNIETIRRWWRRWPHANLGLAIPFGFLVVDIDNPDAYARLQAE